MAYDGKLLARAREKLDNIRADNQAEQQRRLIEVYAKLPEVQRLDAQMRGHMAELVRLTLSKKPSLKAEIDALQDKNLDLQMLKAELLVGKGYAMDYLDDIYSCEKCKDSGIYKAAPCSCLETLYNKELTRELGTLLNTGDECFESFDLSLYSNLADAQQGVIPRDAMKMVFDICRKFADNFPKVSANLLFQGDPGLGKTYLSACIARVVAQKGYSVCYDSSSAALEAFERQKFSRDIQEAEAAATRVRRMLSCDLMILDDLGTEMITPMSVSALYTLINTRLINGKRTIISTNCSDEELQRKYSPQIYSRISGEFLSLPFAGQDIRQIRKGV